MFSSNDVFQGNGGSAIVVLNRSYFESLNSTLTTTVLASRRAGAACFSVAVLSVATAPDGIRVLAASEAIFSGPTITANGGVGVQVKDGSFAGFLAASTRGHRVAWT